MTDWICVILLTLVWLEIATLRHGWKPHIRLVRSLFRRKPPVPKEYV